MTKLKLTGFDKARADAKTRARNMASKLSAKLSVNYDKAAKIYDITIESPEGQRWLENSAHVLCDSAAGETTAELWLELIESMQTGLEPCPEDCDCKYD